MAQTDPHFKIRLAPALKEQIENSAREHKRTMTADITARLEASFAGPERALEGNDLGQLTVDETVLIAILRECDPKQREAFLTFGRQVLTPVARHDQGNAS